MKPLPNKTNRQQATKGSVAVPNQISFFGFDRAIDNYIDGNYLLNPSDKLALRRLLKLGEEQNSPQVKISLNSLSKLMGVNRITAHRTTDRLIQQCFLIYDKSVIDPGLNYHKKVYSFPDKFPGFDRQDMKAEEVAA